MFQNQPYWIARAVKLVHSMILKHIFIIYNFLPFTLSVTAACAVPW